MRMRGIRISGCAFLGTSMFRRHSFLRSFPCSIIHSRPSLIRSKLDSKLNRTTGQCHVIKKATYIQGAVFGETYILKYGQFHETELKSKTIAEDE